MENIKKNEYKGSLYTEKSNLIILNFRCKKLNKN